MEKWQEREHKRGEIIKDAVTAADRIILDGSDGNKEETDYLTAEVAKKFMERALLPLQTALQKKDMDEDDKGR
ncbi:MAG: hypothetical protein A3A08_01700 [Candidatus Nealsonbacteria bacterium RIFCSPLOWO2_01_FULL_41_9]|uniref:Uncharacterized protein n=1 Tax=Candidatus Nealsonbacteria bacterium RIFCSPLOWO2_01_FULL_41_9 TaxID=1801671 RepID=A0A1G2EDI6_9BACT|nr:MAG: hypothetical protein A3A08_01700 [Candidatus Nealsonbacteria bacterium RIFCSPLOWO2_01_FULL_41_9]